MSKNFTLSRDRVRDYVTVTFDLLDEKVNKLSTAVMQEFSSLLDELSTQRDIQMLVFRSGKESMFIAGADISEIENISTEQDALEKAHQGQKILDKLEQLPFPTVAVINGPCLGGGMELALACTYRIATDHPKTILGLPEVNLGIIPGFGGTQRLPKLIDLPSALELILSGKTIPAKKAYRMKVIDSLIAWEFTDEYVTQFVHSLLDSSSFRKKILKRREPKLPMKLFSKTSLTRNVIFNKARENLIKKTNGNYPAPLAALRVIEKTYGKKLQEGLFVERSEFSRLATTEISKNLISIYYTSEILKKDKDPQAKQRASAIKNIGVIGAGIMGGGIGWLFSNKDFPVRLKDLNHDALSLGLASAQKVYNQLIKIRKYKPAEAQNKMHNISTTVDYSGFKNRDLVVEAIVENMNVKKAVLAELENEVNENTIICSNTSSLSITEMASNLLRPENFAGFHFFNPVNRMPLVEIIPGEKTSKETVYTLQALCRRIGKTPIIVGDCAGFLVNRILLPYINESVRILQDGADIENVDQLAFRFGMPMGPFTLADEVGLDIGFHVAEILENSYGDRMKVPQLLHRISEDSSLLGKKSGQGFFTYKGKEKNLNERMVSLLSTISEEVNSSSPTVTENEAVDRMMLIMVNEAARCLEENIVESPAICDMAMIMGTGFPPFRGGILKYADNMGLYRVKERLEQLSEIRGERFAPCNLINQYVREKRNFYTESSENKVSNEELVYGNR